MDDGKGQTETPGGGRIAYRIGTDGPGFYYELPGAHPGARNWGPFPTRDVAMRWHESPSTITPDDIDAIRVAQGYTK